MQMNQWSAILLLCETLKITNLLDRYVCLTRYSQMLCTALGSDPVYFNTVNKLYSFNYHR